MQRTACCPQRRFRVTMIDPHRPILGEPGAACRSCGSTLAEDQRYCLSCGERRAETRLPFLEILAGQRPAPAADPAPAPKRTTTRGRIEKLSSNTAAIAGVGCLLLAVGVGVLIGQGSGDTTQSAAPPPQVISVGGAGTAAATEDATASTADSGASKASSKSSKSDNTADSAADSKATNPALKALDEAGGNDYAKKAAKLPKTVGTGGKAPPKDNKAPAGGGDFEEIQ